MKATIIIPYTKDRGYLKEAIASAENQIYPGDIEIIESQSSEGVCYNINRAFEQSTGDIIRFLCDDDTLPAYSLAHTVKFFKDNPEIDFFHSISNIMNANGTITGVTIPQRTPKTASELASKNYIHGGTVVYRRKCFENQLWDESLWTGEEYEYNMRLLKNGFKLGYLPEVTYNYRRHDNQKSGKNRPKRIEAINQIKRKYR